ncbi:MAG: hypothetical protein NPIRA04_23540 [Nitrospirales bacterium]|nr:MAG: hypothetical protein NPIRA04_23540 [Nitrospirales bacterium]
MGTENLLQSLGHVSRSATDLWVDGHAKDLATLEEFTHLESLSLYRLAKTNIPVLSNLILPKLTSFGLRLVPISDFRPFHQIKSLKDLTIWQCPKLRSLESIEDLPNITSLHVSDLGSPLSLETIERLPKLKKLYISGSVNAVQTVTSLQPIGNIGKRLSTLELHGTKAVDKKLQPLTQLPEPESFTLTPWLFPLEEIALLAAVYPKWQKSLMTIHVDHYKKCGTCGSELRQTFAYRSRAKCPSCDRSSFEKFENDFLALVQEKKNSKQLDIFR